MNILLCVGAVCLALLIFIIWAAKKEAEAGKWIRHHRGAIDHMLGAWNINLIIASDSVMIGLAFPDKATGLQTTGEISNRKAAKILMEMEDVKNPRDVVIKYSKPKKKVKTKQYGRAPRIGNNHDY